MAALAYYNEHDPFAAQWLRELIKAGHIADGIVDERSIEDVRPDELRGYAQCHFFAGIGVWSYALRRAGWADDRPVWTGSCPCQPFSAAGKGGGFADERHLWPHFHWLISQCRPAVVLGEQVASKDGLAWLDLVQADLEGTGYAAGAVDLCAAGIGAPHIRQRLWWVGERLADPQHSLRRSQRLDREDGRDGPDGGREEAHGVSGARREVLGLADAADDGRHEERASLAKAGRHGTAGDGTAGRLALPSGCGDLRPGPTNGLWQAADWLFCRDGKWRPVEPGAFSLAHGTSARVGRLRGYGNAINAEAAKAFIEAYLDTIDDRSLT